MQFHLNGFRPGDPHVYEADVRHQAARSADGLPTQIDVLIVGCGPTGLTLAAQLAAFPDITTRIVEQKSGRLLVGQADGIACRTMEMFEAFGFADRVMKGVSPLHIVGLTPFGRTFVTACTHSTRLDPG